MHELACAILVCGLKGIGDRFDSAGASEGGECAAAMRCAAGALALLGDALGGGNAERAWCSMTLCCASVAFSITFCRHLRGKGGRGVRQKGEGAASGVGSHPTPPPRHHADASNNYSLRVKALGKGRPLHRSLLCSAARSSGRGGEEGRAQPPKTKARRRRRRGGFLTSPSRRLRGGRHCRCGGRLGRLALPDSAAVEAPVPRLRRSESERETARVGAPPIPPPPEPPPPTRGRCG